MGKAGRPKEQPARKSQSKKFGERGRLVLPPKPPKPPSHARDRKK